MKILGLINMIYGTVNEGITLPMCFFFNGGGVVGLERIIWRGVGREVGKPSGLGGCGFFGGFFFGCFQTNL